jgi:hypothetical protein
MGRPTWQGVVRAEWDGLGNYGECVAHPEQGEEECCGVETFGPQRGGERGEEEEEHRGHLDAPAGCLHGVVDAVNRRAEAHDPEEDARLRWRWVEQWSRAGSEVVGGALTWMAKVVTTRAIAFASPATKLAPGVMARGRRRRWGFESSGGFGSGIRRSADTACAREPHDEDLGGELA